MTDAAPTLTITPRQRTLVLIGTLVGMMVAAINQTLVSTILPTIAADLHGLDLYTWVFTANMLALAVSVPIFGKLSDMFGRRRLYITGVATFVVGTLACALAPSMELLIVARVIQGIGMGAIMPLAMAIIADVVPATERGKWQGIMGAVFGIAMVLGPLAGGAIEDQFGWRWAFGANVPLGLIALALIVSQLHLPFHPRNTKIDWAGAVTFGGALVALLLALSKGGTEGHDWGSGFIVGLISLSVALFVAFFFIERHADDPMIPLDMLRDRNVNLTTIAGLAIGAGMFAAVIYVPLFMRSVVGVSSSDAGLALVPLMFGLILTSTFTGILISKTGRYKAIILLGPVLGALGLWLMSHLDASASIFDTAWRMSIVGAGIGFVMQNVMLVAQNSVDMRDMGAVTSLATLARSVGGTVGVAILGTIYATRLPENIAEQVGKLEPEVAQVAGNLNSEQILNAQNVDMPAALQGALQVAASDSITHLFALSIPFMALAFVVSLALRRDELSDRTSVSVVADLEQELADLVPVDAAHAHDVAPR